MSGKFKYMFFLFFFLRSCQAAELGTGLGQLIEELLTGVEGGTGGTCGQAACIDIALPVGTDDDTAVAIHHATGQDGVGSSWVDLGEQQSRAPSADGVT